MDKSVTLEHLSQKYTCTVNTVFCADPLLVCTAAVDVFGFVPLIN